MRFDRRRLMVGLVAGLSLAVTIAGVALIWRGSERGSPGVSETSLDPDDPPSGEVTVAYPEEPRTFNPYLFEGDTAATRDLIRPVLPTLLELTPALRYAPSLATKVPSGKDIGKDPFSVTFRLHPKAVWSDGTPISAADVRFTWETLRDARWPIADRSAYQKIQDVTVVGPKTVRLVFDHVYLPWKDLFSAGDFILPKHALEGQDFAQQMRSGPPVSGGPFLIEKFTQGLEVVYVPNPRWWGRGPGLARVRVVFVPEISTALELLERDRVSVVSSTTQVSLTERLRQAGASQIKSRFGSCWWELVFNTDRPGMKARAFREAVARATDRTGFVEALVQKEGRVLHHMTPGRNNTPYYEALTKDTEASKKSLAVPGARPSSRPSISTVESNEIATLAQRLVQKGMIDAGLMLELVNTEADRLYTEWRPQGNFDLLIVERRGTPSRSLTSDYRSDLKPPAGSNHSRIASAEIDKALDAADKAAAGAAEAGGRLVAEIPVLPLLECKAFLGGKGVTGLDPNATVEGPLWNLHVWRRAA